MGRGVQAGGPRRISRDRRRGGHASRHRRDEPSSRNRRSQTRASGHEKENYTHHHFLRGQVTLGKVSLFSRLEASSTQKISQCVRIVDDVNGSRRGLLRPGGRRGSRITLIHSLFFSSRPRGGSANSIERREGRLCGFLLCFFREAQRGTNWASGAKRRG